MAANQQVGDRGRFLAIVERTIQLARERFEEYQRLYPPTGKLLTGTEVAQRYKDQLSGKQPRPAQRALMEYVSSLDVADMAALVTLHYVGRTFSDDAAPERALEWQRNEMRSSSVSASAYRKIHERSLLHEYLLAGLERAAIIGLDIEELPTCHLR